MEESIDRQTLFRAGVRSVTGPNVTIRMQLGSKNLQGYQGISIDIHIVGKGKHLHRANVGHLGQQKSPAPAADVAEYRSRTANLYRTWCGQ